MWLVRLCFIALWARMAYASGPYHFGFYRCRAMKPGHQQEKCSVKCNTDGSCQETGDKEYCHCDGMATITTGVRVYKDGELTGGAHEKILGINCLKKLEKRCKDCKKGGKGFSYDKTISSKLKDRKNNIKKDCP